MTKSIYFSQVDDPSGTGDFKSYWLPYSVLKVWSYSLAQKDVSSVWEAKDFFFEKLPIQEYLNIIEEPDVLALSSYIWNHEYNLAFAKAVKKKWPQCVIVFGGPEIPEVEDRLDEFYEKNGTIIDYTIHAEGELALANLLRYLDGKYINLMEPGALPQGVTAQGRYEKITPDRIMDLSVIPSPYQNGLAKRLVDENPDKEWSVVMETNRGCPYSCTFCDWGSLTYAKVRKFEQEDVYRDFDFLGDNKIAFLDIADANFGIFKGRDDEIIDYLIDIKKRTGYPGVVNFNWQKNSTNKTVEVVKKLVDNGFSRGFTLSVQSMSEEVLENIKRKNMAVNKFKDVLNLCHKYGIPTYTELILGLPGETAQSWRDGFYSLLDAGQHHSIEIYPALALENAELNTDETIEKYAFRAAPIRNAFRPDGSEIFDGIAEVGYYIVETNTMPFEDYLDSYVFSWLIGNFHSMGWTNIVSRWLHEVDGVPYADFYDGLLEFIKNDDVLGEYIHGYRDRLAQKFSGDGVGGTSSLPYEATPFIYKNHQAVKKSLRKFFNEFNVPAEVIRFNEEFMTNFENQSDKTISFSLPIWETIIGQEYDEQEQYTYIFENTEFEASPEAYNDKLYYRRRQGFGHYKVTSTHNA